MFTAGVKLAGNAGVRDFQSTQTGYGWKACGHHLKTSAAIFSNVSSGWLDSPFCNRNCLSEGFDNPGVEVRVIIQARPTKSRSAFTLSKLAKHATAQGVLTG